MPEVRPTLVLFTGRAALGCDVMSVILKPELARNPQMTSWNELVERVCVTDWS